MKLGIFLVSFLVWGSAQAALVPLQVCGRITDNGEAMLLQVRNHEKLPDGSYELFITTMDENHPLDRIPRGKNYCLNVMKEASKSEKALYFVSFQSR